MTAAPAAVDLEAPARDAARWAAKEGAVCVGLALFLFARSGSTVEAYLSPGWFWLLPLPAFAVTICVLSGYWIYNTVNQPSLEDMSTLEDEFPTTMRLKYWKPMRRGASRRSRTCLLLS